MFRGWGVGGGGARERERERDGWGDIQGMSMKTNPVETDLCAQV